MTSHYLVNFLRKIKSFCNKQKKLFRETAGSLFFPSQNISLLWQNQKIEAKKKVQRSSCLRSSLMSDSDWTFQVWDSSFFRPTCWSARSSESPGNSEGRPQFISRPTVFSSFRPRRKLGFEWLVYFFNRWYKTVFEPVAKKLTCLTKKF